MGLHKFARAAINKTPQTRLLKQQKFIVLEFWNPEGLNKSVGGVAYL